MQLPAMIMNGDASTACTVASGSSRATADGLVFQTWCSVHLWSNFSSDKSCLVFASIPVPVPGTQIYYDFRSRWYKRGKLASDAEAGFRMCIVVDRLHGLPVEAGLCERSIGVNKRVQITNAGLLNRPKNSI